VGCASDFLEILLSAVWNDYYIALACTYGVHLLGCVVVSLHWWWDCKVLQRCGNTAHLVRGHYLKQVKSVIVSLGSLGLWYASVWKYYIIVIYFKHFFIRDLTVWDDWGLNFCSFILKGCIVHREPNVTS
jgi:hypothetical protein